MSFATSRATLPLDYCLARGQSTHPQKLLIPSEMRAFGSAYTTSARAPAEPATLLLNLPGPVAAAPPRAA
jgi:hypothetical protein